LEAALKVRGVVERLYAAEHELNMAINDLDSVSGCAGFGRRIVVSKVRLEDVRHGLSRKLEAGRVGML
jgi:hypothetical protein